MYAKSAEKYFSKFEKLPSLTNLTLEQHENIGLACYCPEKNQKNSLEQSVS